jgi:hypothetical protein
VRPSVICMILQREPPVPCRCLIRFCC